MSLHISIPANIFRYKEARPVLDSAIDSQPISTARTPAENVSNYDGFTSHRDWHGEPAQRFADISYIQSLEAEVASLQARISSLALRKGLPVHSLDGSCKGAGELCSFRGTDCHEDGSENQYAELKDSNSPNTEIMCKIKCLEDDLAAQTKQNSLLQEQVKYLERRARYAELGENSMIKRVEIFGAMVAQDRNRHDHDSVKGNLTADSTLISASHCNLESPQLNTGTAFRIGAHEQYKRFQTSYGHYKRYSCVSNEDSVSWHQGIGIANYSSDDIVEERCVPNSSVAVLKQVSDEENAKQIVTRTASSETASILSPTFTSRPTSLLSSSSFADSWGLPAVAEKSRVDSPIAIESHSNRISYQPRRMRRFPSTSGGLKPLILPNVVTHQFGSSQTHSQPVTSSDHASIVDSPLSIDLNSPDTERPQVSNRNELERLRTLHILEGREFIFGSSPINYNEEYSDAKSIAEHTKPMANQKSAAPSLETERSVFNLHNAARESKYSFRSSSTSQSTNSCTSSENDHDPPCGGNKPVQASPSIQIMFSQGCSNRNGCYLVDLPSNSLPVHSSVASGSQDEHDASRMHRGIRDRSHKHKIGSRDDIHGIKHLLETYLSRSLNGMAYSMRPLHAMSHEPLCRKRFLTLHQHYPSNILIQNAGHLLVRAFKIADKLCGSNFPFCFGGLGWWLFGLSYWRKHSRKQLKSYSAPKTFARGLARIDDEEEIIIDKGFRSTCQRTLAGLEGYAKLLR